MSAPADTSLAARQQTPPRGPSADDPLLSPEAAVVTPPLELAGAAGGVQAGDIELQGLKQAASVDLNTSSPSIPVRFHLDPPIAPTVASASPVDLFSPDGLGKSNAHLALPAAGAAHPRSRGSSMRHHHRPSGFAAEDDDDFLDDDENVRTVLVWQNLSVAAPFRGGGPAAPTSANGKKAAPAKKVKVLLDNVTGSMTGGMWALMGPSGCGKSTLLNTLACRLDVNTTVTGEMRLNGRPYQSAELKKMSGYVMQDDLLNPHLTARETLYYTAALRLPASMTREQREQRVEEVIQEMGLVHCQNVIVGDPTKKGISGGERRRVCIGMELLTKPQLLFLDEPTSGLDSVTALALIKLLHGITRTGKCSMLISIHQPQAKLFALFDRLLLLKSGHILFQGSIPACLQLFEDCGFPVPHYSNPADHILDVITPPMDLSAQETQMQEVARATELRRRREGSKGQAAYDLEVAAAEQEDREPSQLFERSRLGSGTPLGKALQAKRKRSFDHSLMLEREVSLHRKNSASRSEAETSQFSEFAEPPLSTRRPDQKNEALLASKFHAPPVDLGWGQSKPLLLDGDRVGWWRQTSILFQRNLQEALRKKEGLFTSFIQTLVMAALIGLVFLQIGTGQKSTVRRQPLLQFCCINQGMFGALTVINSFPAERALMLRERAAGTYLSSAYFLAKTTVDTLAGIPFTILFSFIVYFLVGLQPVASKFVVFTLTMILCNIAAGALALMIAALCRTTDLSVTVLPMALEVCRLFGGFFLSPRNLPIYFSWLDALSYVKYAYVAISLNELSGLRLHCTDAERRPGVNGAPGECPISTGEQTIDQLGLDFISMGGAIGVLVGYIIFCRIVSYIAIRYMKSVSF